MPSSKIFILYSYQQVGVGDKQEFHCFSVYLFYYLACTLNCFIVLGEMTQENSKIQEVGQYNNLYKMRKIISI